MLKVSPQIVDFLLTFDDHPNKVDPKLAKRSVPCPVHTLSCTRLNTMETSTQVTLSWKEFEHCAGNALRDLHSDQDFADVTLACMDDVQIKAHKFVLSASSLFFKNILTKTAHSHPFLYLKGISGKVLEALLAFMYKGESKVLEADLKEFLDTADELKIRGLFDVAKDFAPSIKSEPATV